MGKYSEVIDNIVKRTGWPRSFASEYAVARLYHHESHRRAMKSAMKSSHVTSAEKEQVKRLSAEEHA